jgi:hypothetical protein
MQRGGAQDGPYEKINGRESFGADARSELAGILKVPRKRRRLAFELVDCENGGHINRPRGCDAQRHSRSCQYAFTGSVPAAGHTEVPDFQRPGIKLPAMRMDDGRQAMDSPTRPVTQLLLTRDGG